MSQPVPDTTKIINVNKVKTMCKNCSEFFPVQDFAEHVKSCNPILQNSAPSNTSCNTDVPISNSTSTASSKSRRNIPGNDLRKAEILKSEVLFTFRLKSTFFGIFIFVKGL